MMTPIRTLLRDARSAAGLSQAELAARIATTTGRAATSIRAQIAAYEVATGADPRPPLTAMVLDALGLDLALIPAVEEKKPQRAI